MAIPLAPLAIEGLAALQAWWATAGIGAKFAAFFATTYAANNAWEEVASWFGDDEDEAVQKELNEVLQGTKAPENASEAVQKMLKEAGVRAKSEYDKASAGGKDPSAQEFTTLMQASRAKSQIETDQYTVEKMARDNERDKKRHEEGMQSYETPSQLKDLDMPYKDQVSNREGLQINRREEDLVRNQYDRRYGTGSFNRLDPAERAQKVQGWFTRGGEDSTLATPTTMGQAYGGQRASNLQRYDDAESDYDQKVRDTLFEREKADPGSVSGFNEMQRNSEDYAEEKAARGSKKKKKSMESPSGTSKGSSSPRALPEGKAGVPRESRTPEPNPIHGKNYGDPIGPKVTGVNDTPANILRETLNLKTFGPDKGTNPDTGIAKEDVDSLIKNLDKRKGQPIPSWDLNANGVVDGEEHKAWLEAPGDSQTPNIKGGAYSSSFPEPSIQTVGDPYNQGQGLDMTAEQARQVEDQLNQQMSRIGDPDAIKSLLQTRNFYREFARKKEELKESSPNPVPAPAAEEPAADPRERLVYPPQMGRYLRPGAAHREKFSKTPDLTNPTPSSDTPADDAPATHPDGSPVVHTHPDLVGQGPDPREQDEKIRDLRKNITPSKFDYSPLVTRAEDLPNYPLPPIGSPEEDAMVRRTPDISQNFPQSEEAPAPAPVNRFKDGPVDQSTMSPEELAYNSGPPPLDPNAPIMPDALSGEGGDPTFPTPPPEELPLYNQEPMPGDQNMTTVPADFLSPGLAEEFPEDPDVLPPIDGPQLPPPPDISGNFPQGAPAPESPDQIPGVLPPIDGQQLPPPPDISGNFPESSPVPDPIAGQGDSAPMGLSTMDQPAGGMEEPVPEGEFHTGATEEEFAGPPPEHPFEPTAPDPINPGIDVPPIEHGYADKITPGPDGPDPTDYSNLELPPQLEEETPNPVPDPATAGRAPGGLPAADPFTESPEGVTINEPGQHPSMPAPPITQLPTVPDPTAPSENKLMDQGTYNRNRYWKALTEHYSDPKNTEEGLQQYSEYSNNARGDFARPANMKDHLSQAGGGTMVNMAADRMGRPTGYRYTGAPGQYKLARNGLPVLRPLRETKDWQIQTGKAGHHWKGDKDTRSPMEFLRQQKFNEVHGAPGRQLTPRQNQEREVAFGDKAGELERLIQNVDRQGQPLRPRNPFGTDNNRQLGSGPSPRVQNRVAQGQERQAQKVASLNSRPPVGTHASLDQPIASPVGGYYDEWRSNMDLAEEMDAENARQGGNPYEHQGTQLGLDYPNSPQDQLGWKMSALDRNLDNAISMGNSYIQDREEEEERKRQEESRNSVLNRKFTVSNNF